MDESEKMRVLKKAYAEIILNTAKEAAARIMVSEKRVQQANHDLSFTKDEAFRLLLRLKQTMDSKLNEAEMKSLHQQRRIEELEAQLQEAEDIVTNLREELNEAHIKMDELKKNQTHNWHNKMEKANDAYENVLSDNVLATQANEQSNTTMVDCTETDSLGENSYVGVHNLPSVNGFIRRLHAYVGNFSNGHIPIAGELDGLKDRKTSRDDEDGKMYKKLLEGSDVGVNNMGIVRCTGQVSKALSEHAVVVKGGDDEVANAQNNAMEENKEVANNLVLIREENSSENCSDVARLNPEVGMKTDSSTDSDAELKNHDEGVTDVQPKDTVLKYTFQRKRKKEGLSSDDSSLVTHENPVKRKTGKKQSSCTEQMNSNSGAESSRDSRRTAQVARQLISLSEKKGWK